jgi:hypothetical protein
VKVCRQPPTLWKGRLWRSHRHLWGAAGDERSEGDADGAQAIERLDEAKIANARMRNVRGFLAHPQLEARDRWREVGSSVGPLRALIPPATLDGTEPVMAPIPSVGEHTARILADLGYRDDAVAALRGRRPFERSSRLRRRRGVQTCSAAPAPRRSLKDA